jgi:glycosyltransferase involved in cell wall biosynthesis
MVSIIIPCYRQAKFLPEAVGSVRSQTFTDWEIVVSAGSEVDMAAAEDLGVRAVYTCLGLSVARNTGIEAAHGELVLPLDADDTIRPTFLERTVAAIEGHDIAATWLQETGTRRGTWDLAPFEKIRQQNCLCCCSLYRKSLWQEVGGYDPAAIGYEDWDYWIRCSRRGVKVAVVPERLFHYRFHAESMTATQGSEHELWIAMMHLRHPDLFAQTEKDRNLVRKMPLWVAQEVERRLTEYPESEALRQVQALAGTASRRV